MKPIAIHRLALGLAHVSVSSVLLIVSAQGQTNAPNPPSSTIVSNSTESVEPGSIKPGRSELDKTSAPDAIAVDPASLLPDLAPVPRSNATLIGGTIAHLDRVRDRVVLSVFGGGRTTVLFDPRTKVYRGSKQATIADMREGERVYLDTILDGSTVFARVIRLSASTAMGESQGVVVKYQPDRGELTLRDGISPTPIQVRTSSSTKFLQDNHAVPATTLAEGSLISMSFGSEGNGRNVAREISILALPGSRFTFSGEVVHIDLRSGLLVLNSSTDRKTYEIYLDPARSPDENLHAGSSVIVETHFENSRYVARDVKITASK